MLVRAEESVLVVVDVQDRLLPSIHESDRVLRNVDILLKAAAARPVPVIVTEQYAKGLGPTAAAVRDILPAGTPVVEKMTFASTGEPAFNDALERTARRRIVLCGTEAHVCVLQTGLGLLAAGYRVHLVADAVSSRTPANHTAAVDRLRAAGASIVTTEMVVFEWTERAGTPLFKTMLGLVR